MLGGIFVRWQNGLMKKIFAIIGSVINIIFAGQNCFALPSDSTSNYITCFDVMYVFARGSGGELGSSPEFFDLLYTAYTMQSIYGIRTRAVDLDYPAVAIDTPRKIIESYVSAGKAYSFGNSVKIGVSNLRLYYRAARAKCPNMKFAFVGYSQGAAVLADAAKYFDRDAVLFIMMLGDPNTYLPEGEGLFPPACFGKKKSSWRTYVPNCRTSSGVFGQRRPYEEPKLAGKYSLWCNRNDYICGSSKNPLRNNGHVEYAGLGFINIGVPLLMKKSGYKATNPPLRASMVDNWLDELEDSGGGANISAPKIDLRREADVVYLKWKAVAGAEDLLIRFNGIDLGYVDASLGEFEIRDIDPEQEFRLDFAWMDKDGELSEITENEDDSIEMAEKHVVEKIVPQIVKAPEASRVAPESRQEIASEATMDSVANQSIARPSDKNNTKSLPSVKKNGWELMPEDDAVWIIVSMAAASSLLVLLFVKWRH